MASIETQDINFTKDARTGRKMINQYVVSGIRSFAAQRLLELIRALERFSARSGVGSMDKSG